VRRSAAAIGALVIGAALVPAAAGAGVGPIKTVTLHDDYFSPSKMTVKSGTTIKWNWPTGLTDTHDVMLGKHPRGVKRFMSDYAAGGYSFKRKLTVPGTYTFVCDIHQGMAMKIVVKR
jgi:plastocyanin